MACGRANAEKMNEYWQERKMVSEKKKTLEESQGGNGTHAHTH